MKRRIMNEQSNSHRPICEEVAANVAIGSSISVGRIVNEVDGVISISGRSRAGLVAPTTAATKPIKVEIVTRPNDEHY